MLMFKNMTKEILKNKIFLILLFVMTVCSSFMFFFIRFSIDANLANLEALSSLTHNQQNYMRALNSNNSLAITVLFTVCSVTALAFALFYFRFFASAKKQIGILKAVGYKNTNFQLYFSLFAVLFSIVGLLVGMLLGYLGSSVHISANMQSYGVTGLVKGINLSGVALGIFVPLIIFGLTMYLCGFSLYKKNNVELLNSTSAQKSNHLKLLKFAGACVSKLPIKNKAPLRIALRQPLSIVVIIAASMMFTVMLVLGWSLTSSGDSIYKSQTVGHNYKYESHFDAIQSEQTASNAIHYLSFDSKLVGGTNDVEQAIIGMDFDNEIYNLRNMDGENLSSPTDNNCYITEELKEMYSIKVGEDIILQIGEQQITAKVIDVAYNAKLKTVIFSRAFIVSQMGYSQTSFNGVLSCDNIYPNADLVIDNIAKNDELKRNKVSSQVSAVINQLVGVLSGMILMFLALFITFQYSTRDMMILGNLGHSNKEIKRLLINIFLPILIVGYIITAFPAVMVARAVQFSLSLQTGDYMPFSTNILVLLVGLIAVVAIYIVVQAIFSLAIKHTLKKKSILQYTNEL